MYFRNDPTQYTTIPTRTYAGTMSLARALIGAAPQDPHPAIATRLHQLELKAEVLQSNWITARHKVSTGAARRAQDRSVDRCWGAFRSRLLTWPDIGDEERGARAEELDQLLFPTGLAFLNLPWAEQWAESERRLALIADEALGEELADLVDARVFENLRKAHDRYGEVLGITSKQDEDSSVADAVESLRELRAALAGYARLVLGLCDEDEPESVAAAEDVLAPILRYRKARRGQGSGELEDELELDLEEALELDALEASEPPMLDEP